MLIFKHLSMKNFFSFGNISQNVQFNETELALVLGHNKDASVTDDNQGHRNGVGKSAIIHGLVFGLYGKSIDNSIKIPNLVNKENGKNCVVEIEFEKDGVPYRIVRGRSPTFFHYTILNSDGTLKDDDTRGETKHTQEDLDKIIGISQKLFEHIVVLNANVDPFLSLPQQKQRDMIEELLGISQLTEKAQLLKDMCKDSNKIVERELFKIQTIQSTNEKINESINTLKEQSDKFVSDKESKIDKINTQLMSFSGVDFDDLKEKADIKEQVIAYNNDVKNKKQNLILLKQKFDTYNTTIENNKISIQNQISVLNDVDIEHELSLHQDNATIDELSAILKQNKSEIDSLNKDIVSYNNTIKMHTNNISTLEMQLNEIKMSVCPLCKSDISHNHSSTELLTKITTDIENNKTMVLDLESKIESLTAKRDSIDVFDIPSKSVTYYNDISDAKLHSHKLNELKLKLSEPQINIYQEEYNNSSVEFSDLELIDVPDYLDKETIYGLEAENKRLISELGFISQSSNPYTSQIDNLKENSIQNIDYTEYNKYSELAEHQDFLSKLLLNKDSFVRKRIIDKNLTYLNNRLQYYIDAIGSMHKVVFMNDLGVDIEMNGQSYDYKQLSRGERTRIIIALNLAFRDTFESLYYRINILLVDELFDDGLDTTGIVDAWRILQDMSTMRNKNIYIVSHRDELLEKAESVLKITKEKRFSTIQLMNTDDI